MNVKSNIIGEVYLHKQLCEVCGKVAQSYEQVVYGTNLPRASFDNNNIPVGWRSEGKRVYCPECKNK